MYRVRSCALIEFDGRENEQEVRDIALQRYTTTTNKVISFGKRDGDITTTKFDTKTGL